MPTYQYRCTDCGSELEVVQKFTDHALTECPKCEGTLRKVYNAVGVHFKGSGFYATDSRAKNSATSTSSSRSSGSSDSSSGGSTESSGSSSTSSSSESSSSKSSEKSSGGSSTSSSDGKASTSSGSGSSNPA